MKCFTETWESGTESQDLILSQHHKQEKPVVSYRFRDSSLIIITHQSYDPADTTDEWQRRCETAGFSCWCWNEILVMFYMVRMEVNWGRAGLTELQTVRPEIFTQTLTVTTVQGLPPRQWFPAPSEGTGMRYVHVLLPDFNLISVSESLCVLLASFINVLGGRGFSGFMDYGVLFLKRGNNL